MPVRKVLLSMLLLPSLAFGGGEVAPPGGKVASRAMQCFTIYRLMLDAELQDEFQGKVLHDQAIFMATINVVHTHSKNPSYDEAEFNRIWDFVSKAHVKMGQADPELFADRLIQCEGWREDIVRYYASEIDKPENEGKETEVLLGVPEPQQHYPLTGASRDQVLAAVVSALRSKE